MLQLLNSASTSAIANMIGGGAGGLGGILGGIGSNDGGLMSVWSQTFLPELNSLIADANSYASPARIQQAMGAAESGVAQAMDQGQQNALRDLQSFGIDPSSGRYAQLDQTTRIQRAAAQAGAGNVAEQQVEAIARGLRSEAIQATAQLPSQAASMIGANAQVFGVQVQAALGALNAQLEQQKINNQNAQFKQSLAASLIGRPTGQGGSGQSGKSPAAGSGSNDNQLLASMEAQDAANENNQRSTAAAAAKDAADNARSSDNAQLASQTSLAAADIRAGNKTGSQDSSQAGALPTDNHVVLSDGSHMTRDSYNAMQRSQDINQDNQQDQEEDQAPAVLPGLDPSTGINAPQADASQPPSWYNAGNEGAPLPEDSTQLAGEPPTPDTPDNTLPPEDGGNQPDSGAIPDMSMDQSTPDQPTAGDDSIDNTLSPADGGNADNTLPPEDGGNDWNSALPPTDTSGGDTSGGDNSGGDNTLPPEDGGNSDNTLSSDDGGGTDDGGGDDSFAQGGPVAAVHNRSGAIPASMSPSGGNDVDDVPATLHGTGEQIRLNQGEFIIPRDVVGWRGEGFYQKDIQKARQEREGAIAKPTMKPAIPMGAQ